MDRQHRRDLKHDRFVDEIGSLSSKARENQRILLTVTIAAVVIAIIGYGIYFYRSDREQKAQAQLGKAIETIESPLIEPTLPKQDPTAKFKTDAERTAAAEPMFKKLRADYSGTEAADVAEVYLARIQTERGDVKGARTYLEDFIKSQPKNLLTAGARYSLYQLRIDSGEAAQVSSELTSEMGKADPVLPVDSLLALQAHAYDVQGNGEKVKETYRRIITEFPDSPYAVEAQRRVGPA